MEPSGSGGPPVKRSFPVGTRVGAHSISSNVCFFCGAAFPVPLDYQRHIFHEHQMASIAYQLFAEDHPPDGKKGEKKKEEEGEKKKEEGEKKEVVGEKKKEEREKKKERKRGKEDKKKRENGDEKRPKRVSPLPPFAAPSPPVKSLPPPLPPGRHPATKQHRQSTADGESRKSSKECVSRVPPKPMSESPCAVCKELFRNATELVVHNIRHHEAEITKIEIEYHYGDETQEVPQLEFEWTEECEQCNEKTPTQTKSFEHSIVYHKGNAFINTEATAVTYKATTVAQPDNITFDVRIKLRRTVASSKA